MEHGDYVGVLSSNGKIRCPIMKVATVTNVGFSLELPGIGETRIYTINEDIWTKIEGHELDESDNCGCCRCDSPLIELALSAN